MRVVDRDYDLFEESGNYYEVKLVEDGRHARFKRIYLEGAQEGEDFESDGSHRFLDQTDVINNQSIG